MITIDFTSASALSVGVCGIFWLIQLLYIGGLHNRLHRHFHRLRTRNPEVLPPLSVVIVTKDSGEMLAKNLPAILEQDYPEFEVIVVNDKSAGEDELVLKRLSAQYSRLYHTFIPETARYVSRKKLGIAMGIRASKYDWIVVTTPFCRPVSPHWLRSLAEQMDEDTDIVLGYSNYVPRKGYFARRITFDAFFHAVRYLGMAIAGCPYMGVGNNLAYRKSSYLNHKGFSDHLQLQRGEDDLFVNAIAHKGNTKVATGKDSIVRMPVPSHKREWKEQKMNALVTGHYYKGWAPKLNGFETITCVLFRLSLIVSLAISLLSAEWAWAIVAALLGVIRFLSATIVLQRTAQDLDEHFGCFLPWFDWLRPAWSLIRQIQYRSCRKAEFLRK